MYYLQIWENGVLHGVVVVVVVDIVNVVENVR